MVPSAVAPFHLSIPLSAGAKRTFIANFRDGNISTATKLSAALKAELEALAFEEALSLSQAEKDAAAYTAI